MSAAVSPANATATGSLAANNSLGVTARPSILEARLPSAAPPSSSSNGAGEASSSLTTSATGLGFM